MYVHLSLTLLTFFTHSCVHALLQSAVLAAVSSVLLNGTVSTSTAGIASVGTDTPPKEALACLTAQDSKVVARGCVSTDLAQGMLQGVVWDIRRNSFYTLWVVGIAEIGAGNHSERFAINVVTGIPLVSAEGWQRAVLRHGR